MPPPEPPSSPRGALVVTVRLDHALRAAASGAADELRRRWAWLLLPALCVPLAWAFAGAGGTAAALRVVDGWAFGAALLVGSRLGIAAPGSPSGDPAAEPDPERRLSVPRRLGQVVAQAMALVLPAPGFLFAFDNALGAGAAVTTGLVVALLAWSSTAAATRFVRGPLVLLGPVASLAAVRAVLFGALGSQVPNVAAAALVAFGLTVSGLTLALLPFRPDLPRRGPG
jgi:hypothetical protein